MKGISDGTELNTVTTFFFFAKLFTLLIHRVFFFVQASLQPTEKNLN